MKNGDTVQIYRVQTDKMDVDIPSDIRQDGENNTLVDFPMKIYFTNSKKVNVNFVHNINGQQLKSIRLDNLRDVSF